MSPVIREIMAKKIDVFIGNYGSGKTELSLNRALGYARQGKTAIVDLDIVNPYFRSSEKREMLERQGVRVLAPTFASKAVDLPVLPAEIMSVFIDDSQFVVFDVGGDPVGATALGGYHEHFAAFRDTLTVYDVVNIRRPFTSSVDACLKLIADMEARSRQHVDALINNGNTARDTTTADLWETQALLREVSDISGKPIAYTCGWKHILDAFEAELSARGEQMSGEKWAVDTFMRPDWLDLRD